MEVLDQPGIHVCTVVPSVTDTPFFRHAANVQLPQGPRRPAGLRVPERGRTLVAGWRKRPNNGGVPLAATPTHGRLGGRNRPAGVRFCEPRPHPRQAGGERSDDDPQPAAGGWPDGRPPQGHRHKPARRHRRHRRVRRHGAGRRPRLRPARGRRGAGGAAAGAPGGGGAGLVRIRRVGADRADRRYRPGRGARPRPDRRGDLRHRRLGQQRRHEPVGPVRGDPARGPGPARRGKLGRRDQRRPRRAAVLLRPRRARGHHQHRLGRRPRADAARGDLQRPRRGSPASPRRSASSSRPARPSRSAASTWRSPTRRRTCTRRTIPAGRCAPSRRSSTRSRWPRRSSGWRCGRGAPCTSAARTPWRCPAPWRRR